MTAEANISEARGSERHRCPLAAVTGSLTLGGSSTFLVNLARAFTARGLSLPITVLSEDYECASDFAGLNADINLVSRRCNIYEDRLRLGYEALARHETRAVLACLGAESFEILRLLPAGVLRLGIVQSHDPGPYEAIKIYARHLDAVVGVSLEITRHLSRLAEVKEHGVRVEYIPYGIAFEDGPPRPRRPRVEPLRVIYVGRLIEVQKRISRLVAVVRKVTEARLPVEFTIVGSGPEESLVRRELAGVTSVHFTGALPNDQIQSLLREHDIFILLSDFEGLPLSLLEAMGNGVVPLVSDLESGMSEVVSSNCGFLVPVGDVDRAVEILSSLSTDRSCLEEMSRAARYRAREKYSAERMAERYVEMISSFSPPKVAWPQTARVPAPYGMRPWLYQGAMRSVRRWLKRLRAQILH